MTTKVVVIFYSLYTHTWQLAQAIVEGAHEVEGVEVELYQVPELLSDEVISKMGATQPKEAMKHIPVLTSEIRKEVIKSADAIFFGSPTRFGVMTAQMKSFFDALGGLWFENACVGKVASCFTGTGAQHGGQETTLFSMITPLLHLGFIYVGLPYSCKEQKEINEISGGTPYGSTFIAGSDGSRAVSINEKACARYQGRHVAQIARELRIGRERVSGGMLSTGAPAGGGASSASNTTTTTSSPVVSPVPPEGVDEPSKSGDKKGKSGDKKSGDKKAGGDKKPSGSSSTKSGEKGSASGEKKGDKKKKKSGDDSGSKKGKGDKKKTKT